MDILVLNVVPGTPDREFLNYMKARGGGDHFYATDSRLSVAEADKVQYLGTLIAVGPQGHLAAKWDDSVSYEQVKRTIDQLRG